MTTQFDSAVARIYAQGDRIIGAGFLVRDRQVLTCAHVVASAAGLSGNAQEPPDSVVHLDFPLVDRHRRIPARVVHWVPVDADGEGDIAGLELLEDPPADVQPARLVVAEEVWGHQYRAFGFPAGYDDGVWVSGRVLARQAIQWVQLDVGQPGYRMESGFSGAPVWDDELEGVVGMAVATETRTDVRTAYLIPTGFLIDAWPSLTTQAIPPSPYRGLSAFREQDAQFFFGRDDVIDELSNRIRQHPIVSVVGPSGSGKSSVVLAGLIPRLRADGHWITVNVRPSTHQSAFEALAIALLPFLEPTMSEAGWLQELPALSAVLAGGRLPQAASRILEKTGASRLLIVVDQLEELYTSTASGRQEFVASLLEAASAGGQRSQPELVMVLTIRADFLGHVMAHPGFTEALQGALVMVGPMSMVNLRQAIERPVSHRVTFEPGLIERILGDVGTAPGNLPLLEFSLTLLWQRQVLGHLTHAAYDQLGGVAGSLTRYAEEVYAGLSEPEQQDMRRIFVQLTIPGQDTGHTRRTALRSDLGDDRWALVQRLATSRLLVTGQDLAGGETVELAHEALLTGWSRLHHWIQEDRDFRVWQEETRSAIRRWEMSSRDEGGLLRGVLLVEAEQWLERRADDLSSTEQTFIRASGNLRDREEREARRRRWLRRLPAALVVLALVAITSLIVAQQQTRRAQAENRVATSRQLAAQATSNLDTRPDLALLLSLRALRTADTVEAHKSLLAALQHDPRLSGFLPVRGIVSALAYSPDGHLLATNEDRDIVLWSVHERRPIARLTGGRDTVSSLAFSPDGRTLAEGDAHGILTVWDVERRAARRKFDTQPHVHERGPVSRVAYTADGTRLAAAAWFGGVFIWDIKHKSTRVLGLPRPGDPDDQIYSVTFSSNGRFLATGGYAGIALWDTTSSKPRLSTLIKYPIGSGGFYDVAFMQDDQLLVALGEQEAILWDRRTGERIASLSHPRPIGAFGQLAISNPSRPIVVAIPTTNGVVLWDAKRRKTVGAPMVGSDKPASVVAFSPDGRVMAAGGNGSLSLWDVHSSTNLGHSLPQGFGSSVGFSPDGRILATGSDDGKVTLWDPERGRNLRSYTSHPSTYAGGESFTTHPVLSLAFSPDGQTLASSDSKSVVVWDIKNWHPLARPLIGHFDDMGYSPGDWSVAFNPRGPTFASISTEGVTLWDTLHWQRIKTLDVGHGSFTAIAFNPNGTVLAIGSGAQIILWDMKNMRPTGSPLTSGSPIAFSPSGRLLASVSQRDSTIILWDVEHHKTVGKPLPLTNPAVSSLAFSPDGRTLAIGSEGENQEVPNVMLWDVNQREPLGKPLVGSGGSVAFAPDGRTLAAAGQGGVILWRVGIAEWRNQACDLLRSLAVPNASLELSRQEYQRLCG